MKTNFKPLSEKERELWKSPIKTFLGLDENDRKAWYKDYEDFLSGKEIEKINEELSVDNDGLTASWYELPEGATELKHLIWYKNMNAQVGEIFRACYRMNDCPHSDVIRNLNKIIAYAEQEKERIRKYGL